MTVADSGHIHIRPAGHSDAEQMCAIINPVIRDTVISYSFQPRCPANFADAISSGNALIAQETGKDAGKDGGQVVGYGTLGVFRGADGYAWTCEHSIYLAPGVAGLGVGRRMMLALQDLAIARGVHVLMAGIGADNVAGQKFHVAMGFEKVGHLRDVAFKHGQWRDLILMQKILLAASADNSNNTV
jgi:phosphinothricin acetyltransferase